MREFIEKKVRRFVMKRKGRKGFGWKRWSREEIYKNWGLYNDYQIRLTNAPTASLKRMYQKNLQELKAAVEVLAPGLLG
jgi:RNA-directed DNA polymerase